MDGFWGGFGRVSGEVWDRFGRIWKGMGTLLDTFVFGAGLCWPGLVYAGFAWVLGGSVKLLGALEDYICPGASEASEQSERAKLSGASSGWPIVHALFCCCLVFLSA